MLDRNRVITIIAVLVAVIALIVAAIALLLPRTDTATPQPPPSATQTPTTSETLNDEVAQATAIFDRDFRSLTTDAATQTIKWDISEKPENRADRYRQVGFSEELIRSYTPVWQPIFTGCDMAYINENVTPPTLKIDEIHGTKGHYIWRVKATGLFDAGWSKGKGVKHDSKFASWYFTVDQASGKITAIDNPKPEDLKINLDK